MRIGRPLSREPLILAKPTKQLATRPAPGAPTDHPDSQDVLKQLDQTTRRPIPRWQLLTGYHPSPPHRRPGRDDRGDAVVTFVLGIALMVLAVGGIAVAGWHIISADRALQTEAASAADAGASGINIPYYRATGTATLDSTEATSLALTNIAQQQNPQTLSGPPLIAVTPQRITVTLTANTQLPVLDLLTHRSIHLVATGSSTPYTSNGG